MNHPVPCPPPRRCTRAVLVLLTGSLAALPAADAVAAGPNGRDVMMKNDIARTTSDLTAEATLTVGENGDQKVKTFSLWRKLAGDGRHFRSLSRFTAPAEVRGEGILFLENDGGNNDVQLYLPRFKKIRRVEAQSQSTSFMGSAFSYSDMTAAQVDDYRHSLLRSEPCPTEPAVSCYVIESVPTAQGAKDRTAYARTVSWVRSDNFLMAQGEAYDAGNTLWKRTRSTDIREIDPSTHKLMAMTLRVDDLKGQKFSVLSFHDVKVNTGVSDGTFTPQSLSRE